MHVLLKKFRLQKVKLNKKEIFLKNVISI